MHAGNYFNKLPLSSYISIYEPPFVLFTFHYHTKEVKQNSIVMQAISYKLGQATEGLMTWIFRLISTMGKNGANPNSWKSAEIFNDLLNNKLFTVHYLQ